MVGYAEIHYHLRYLYPAYFRRQPEIIADLPRRLDLSISASLPLAVIIKDADKYPVFLESVTVLLHSDGLKQTQEFSIKKQIKENWYSEIFPIDIAAFKPDCEVLINVEMIIKIRGKKKVINGDNFAGLSRKPFRTWLAEKVFDKPENWWAGDIHYHSNYTSDQVEFGADISTTKVMAMAQGLDWFCVTDHSYDLDDKVDDFLHNDADLPKWKMMREECRKLDFSQCRIIAGEEVSIGNSKGSNVHLLALNEAEFITGHGDSAEIWFQNKPQHLLKEIKVKHNDQNLFIAAHPLEKVPLAQKLTLRRGNWDLKDYKQSGVNIMQLINSDEPREIEKAIKTWTEYLLKGEKLYICAGNDAHGNFNIMRQISFPFVTLWETHKQTFGNWVTLVNSATNEPLDALRKGRMIVSNGPFLSFTLSQLDRHWQFGETCELRHATVSYDARTTPEYGEIETIYCYRGDIDTGKEFMFPVACPVNIALPENGYIRMSMLTEKGFLVYTNPVFTKQNK